MYLFFTCIHKRNKITVTYDLKILDIFSIEAIDSLLLFYSYLNFMCFDIWATKSWLCYLNSNVKISNELGSLWTYFLKINTLLFETLATFSLVHVNLYSFRPIVSMIRGRNVQVQVKASLALRALAESNTESQQAFLELDAPKVLIRLYVKVKKFDLSSVLISWFLAQLSVLIRPIRGNHS